MENGGKKTVRPALCGARQLGKDTVNWRIETEEGIRAVARSEEKWQANSLRW